MKKFEEWLINNDKKQRLVAKKLGISTSTLNLILKKKLIPSLKIAYEIEKYTNGQVTVYDWIDQIKINNELGDNPFVYERNKKQKKINKVALVLFKK